MILLPIPKQYEEKEGSLILTSKFSVNCESARVYNYLNSFIEVSEEKENTQIVFSLNPDFECEEYELKVTENSIDIAGGDEEALFRGAQTIKQIILQAEDNKIPCLEIKDKPDIKRRGIMLDISRGRIQSPETIKKLADIMADLKYNELQLYFDNIVFEYKSMAQYYEIENVLTIENIKDIQAYCKEIFIELVPNQNSLGHMQGWIAKDEFNHLGITRDDKSPSATINPLLPESLELVDRLYADSLPLFESDKVNIGMDEPFELGKGETKEACEKEGIAKVYTDYLKKVCNLAKEKYNKRPMFWDDVVLEHPECIKELPEDAIVVDWGYEAYIDFEERTRRLSEAGLDFYVAPGTSNWASITGRGTTMLYNIMVAADSGTRWGAMGFLLTDWCDDGGVMPLFMSYIPYIVGAAYSWNSKCDRSIVESGEAELWRISYRRRILREARDYADKFIFKTEGKSFAHVLHKLGKAHTLEHYEIFNTTQLSWLPRILVDDIKLAGLDPEYFEEMEEYVKIRKEEGLKCVLKCEDAELIMKEYELICDIAIFLTNALRISAGEYNSVSYNAELPPLEPIKERFIKLWNKRNLNCGHETYLKRISGVCEKAEKFKSHERKRLCDND